MSTLTVHHLIFIFILVIEILSATISYSLIYLFLVRKKFINWNHTNSTVCLVPNLFFKKIRMLSSLFFGKSHFMIVFSIFLQCSLYFYMIWLLKTHYKTDCHSGGWHFDWVKISRDVSQLFSKLQIISFW
jgi:hypothetical protein